MDDRGCLLSSWPCNSGPQVRILLPPRVALHWCTDVKIETAYCYDYRGNRSFHSLSAWSEETVEALVRVLIVINSYRG